MFGTGTTKVLLAWDRVKAPRFRVEQETSRSRSALGDLWTVWYRSADGRDAEFRDAGVRPLRVADTAHSEPTWSEHRRERIAAWESTYARATEPVQLLLPVYRVGGGEHLILDGTHRSVAAHRAKVPVRLMLVVLVGPISRDVLPDLRYYES